MPTEDEFHRLWNLCKGYIALEDITVAESIYQRDSIVESAFAFIEAICDVVGYSQAQEK